LHKFNGELVLIHIIIRQLQNPQKNTYASDSSITSFGKTPDHHAKIPRISDLPVSGTDSGANLLISITFRKKTLCHSAVK